MTCPKCSSEDTAIVTHYDKTWIFPDFRFDGGLRDVTREQVDMQRCLDCGHEWREE